MTMISCLYPCCYDACCAPTHHRWVAISNQDALNVAEMAEACLERHAWHQHATGADVARVTQPLAGSSLNPSSEPPRYNSQVTSRTNSPIYPSIGSADRGGKAAAMGAAEIAIEAAGAPDLEGGGDDR